jgi:hypothetical protein
MSYWEEAAIAAGCSLIWFVVFSTQAAMRVGRLDGFPVFLRHIFPSAEDPLGPARHRVAALTAGVFAALGQTPVLAVALYRGATLGMASLLLLVGEIVLAIAWIVLLARWIRASAGG